MKNRKFFYSGGCRQVAGLAGGEMLFFSGHIFLGVQKNSLDKQVIGSLNQFLNFGCIGLIVDDVRDVAYFLAGCDQGNFSRQISQEEIFGLLPRSCTALWAMW